MKEDYEIIKKDNEIKNLEKEINEDAFIVLIHDNKKIFLKRIYG